MLLCRVLGLMVCVSSSSGGWGLRGVFAGGFGVAMDGKGASLTGEGGLFDLSSARVHSACDGNPSDSL